MMTDQFQEMDISDNSEINSGNLLGSGNSQTGGPTTNSSTDATASANVPVGSIPGQTGTFPNSTMNSNPSVNAGFEATLSGLGLSPKVLLAMVHNFCAPKIDSFDGESESRARACDFLSTFVSESDRLGWDDDNKKLMFSKYLTGQPLDWYNRANKHMSWLKLKAEFLNRYGEHKPSTGLEDLFNIEYRDDPQLFINSINDAFYKMHSVHIMDQTISVAIKKLPEYLKVHFVVDRPATFDEFRKRLDAITSILKPRKKRSAEELQGAVGGKETNSPAPSNSHPSQSRDRSNSVTNKGNVSTVREVSL